MRQNVIKQNVIKQNAISTGIQLVAVGEASTRKALARVIGCQSCCASVSHPFSSVLTEVLGRGKDLTEYVICIPPRCPKCAQAILENTLVRCEGEGDDVNSANLDFGRSWDAQ